MKVFVVGANGFIGSALVHRILTTTDWQVVGLDTGEHRLISSLGHRSLAFRQGDLTVERGWVDRQIRECDVVVPLAAIAVPVSYLRDPLSVYELNFEENLRIVRQAARSATRVVFPSSSEVYGMSTDPQLDEDTSPLVHGPIHKQRWIYATSKQLLDRLIWAYGASEGLRFTLFRPFNWMGPHLDDLAAAPDGGCRVVTRFLGNILQGRPIELVDGGHQRRAFTYIDDGIDCLMKILKDRSGAADGRIFNIGNPSNDIAIRDLASALIDAVAAHPQWRERALATPLVEVPADEHYGPGYEDVRTRLPSIERARTLLGWQPRTALDEALRRTVAHHCADSGPQHGALIQPAR
ncbi:bifunctional UDP-4-keto-pentose/UDP-xylose synthase [Streptomyces sp. NPDC050636]|uniref:bifunctional UDP-4-keto-pentose/UDP-xylose synthase n=1 Tax=Streptomyces sp. NPDC050636 TaxID=3154510 RepID=UPI00341B365A